MNLSALKTALRDLLYPEAQYHSQKILQLEEANLGLSQEKDYAIAQLEQSLEEISVLQESYDQCVIDLASAQPAKTDLDSYCDSIFIKQKNIAYKQKRKSELGNDYSVYLNELVQPNAFEVDNFFRSTNVTGNNYDVAKSVGNKIAKNIVWTDDKNLSDSGDYYLYPSETIVDGKGDCEDHTFVAMSASPEIGGAWGFYKGGGHAFNVFVHNDQLYILETTGSRARIIKYAGQTDYVIHYIISRDNTYVVKGGVRFGDIAGWY